MLMLVAVTPSEERMKNKRKEELQEPPQWKKLTISLMLSAILRLLMTKRIGKPTSKDSPKPLWKEWQPINLPDSMLSRKELESSSSSLVKNSTILPFTLPVMVLTTALWFTHIGKMKRLMPQSSSSSSMEWKTSSVDFCYYYYISILHFLLIDI